MRGLGGSEDCRALGVAGGLDQIAALLANDPSSAGFRKLEMRHIDARCPVLWLHEQCLTDRGSPILLVRVSVDQKIDAWHFARDPSRHVLTRNSGRHGVIARRLVETRVNRDEHDVGAGASHFVDRLPDRGYDVAEAETSANIL